MEKQCRSVAEEIVRSVLRGTDCTECGNCCREVAPVFSELEITEFVKGLDLTEQEFRDQYLVFDELRGGFCFNEVPCPFLKDNACTNYENRPRDCRDFPYVNTERQVSILLKTDYEHSFCPVIRKVCRRINGQVF